MAPTAESLDPLSLGTPVIVAAPHPDDETLGCGGLIALLTQAGLPVHVVTVSDGAASHPDSKEWPRERMAALRRAESDAALDALGVPTDARHRWEIADGAVPRRGQDGHEALVARATALLDALGAKTLILPWRRDPHSDHKAVSAIFRAAAGQARLSPAQLEYPIWSATRSLNGMPMRPHEGRVRKIDISAVLERKRAAIDQHQSQLGRVVTDVPHGVVIDPDLRARMERNDEIYWQVRD